MNEDVTKEREGADDVIDDVDVRKTESGDGSPKANSDGGEEIKAKVAEMTKQLEEMRKLMSDVAEMRGKVDVLAAAAVGRSAEQSQQSAQTDPLSFLDSAEVREDILADPDKLVGTMKRMADVFLRSVIALDVKMERALADLKEKLETSGELDDAEVAEMVKSIGEKPWADKLSLRERIELAREMLAQRKDTTKGTDYPGRIPRGGGGAGGRSGSEYSQRVAELLRRGGWLDGGKDNDR